jgi:hypothetical protein
VHHSIDDKGGKFATGGVNTSSTNANYTCGKFAAGVNDAGGKLPSVSTTPVANLPPVLRYQWQTKGTISDS